ncbi:hypothetical protein [Parasynechococcus sp.]|uniref:hypothetical protein n=1 Tax=Parasynechococcus sp. TaxID=3101203 RepID=UPI003704494D
MQQKKILNGAKASVALTKQDIAKPCDDILDQWEGQRHYMSIKNSLAGPRRLDERRL